MEYTTNNTSDKIVITTWLVTIPTCTLRQRLRLLWKALLSLPRFRREINTAEWVPSYSVTWWRRK